MMKKLVRVIAFVLILASLFTTTAFAEVSSLRNSYYIDSYVAYLYSPGSGNVQIWFDITANTSSDKIGAQTIFLQVSDDDQNWTNLKTFRYADYPNMMASDNICNVSHVDASVESGHYYRAGLTFYVEDNGGSDSRFYTTDSIWI